jgi:hypothetical protein
MKKLAGSLTLLMLAACAGSDQVGISVRAGAPRTGAATTQEQALTLSNGIELTRVRMVIQKLDLEQEGEDESMDGTEREEVEAGPFLVDVSGSSLSGQAAHVLDMSVAAGTYDELEIKIQKLEDSDAKGDAKFADMVAKEASVIIDGKIDGQDFSFVSALSVEQEHEASFTIGEGAGNITLNLDVTKWFTSESGQRLDPRQSTNKSAIEESIKRSIDAFDDDDEDGAEDRDDDSEN